MKKNIKGITLIALIITIIILLILSGVSIAVLTQNGLIQNANKAKETNEKKSGEEEINLIIMEYKMEKIDKLCTLNDFKEYCEGIDKIDKESLVLYWNPRASIIDGLDTFGEGEAKYLKLKLKEYKYEYIIDNQFKIVEIYGDNNKETNEKTTNEGLIGKISSINKSGNYEIEINVKDTINKYNTDVIVYNKDLVLDGNNQIEGATLKENVYEFGNEDDVGKADEYAKRMVVVKVNGNITINKNITLTSIKSNNGYGGPKGMLIYCTGNINNEGTISMTARGAKAEGEDIYLWKNSDGTYEYIPSTGATGGESQYASFGLNGNDGDTVSLRATGGGGAAGGYRTNGGNGATGTSYSGGTGGGAGGRVIGENGTENGGQGGNAKYSNDSQYNGGGAGNPGGNPSVSRGEKGENGTGGTLIIYSNNIDNSGKIESEGSNGGNGDDSSGGASGGGSINIFYKSTYIEQGVCSVKGGTGVTTAIKGGNGGTGTINTGTLKNGTYVDSKKIVVDYTQVKSDSLIKAINEIKGSGYYKVNIKDENYKIHLYQFDGNQKWETNKVFGDANDVGDKDVDASNMVVIKINGDLEIGENSIITSFSKPDGYGGPKGMLIYCTGTINNKGTISMTGKGAKAKGENIYLWKNSDETYEYIPSVGATGGTSQYNSFGLNGNNGDTVSPRATGGGGAAGGFYSNGGNGAMGTSYSGGTGGGAGGRATGGNGTENGGQGGNANDANDTQYNGGGAGNPGGKPSKNRGKKGDDGTGGTLIIYGSNIDNSGKIESEGSNGGNGDDSSGGASGGGSINIFYKSTYIEKGTYSVKGGTGGTSAIKGGNGGIGSFCVTKINLN